MGEQNNWEYYVAMYSFPINAAHLCPIRNQAWVNGESHCFPESWYHHSDSFLHVLAFSCRDTQRTHALKGLIRLLGLEEIENDGERISIPGVVIVSLG